MKYNPNEIEARWQKYWADNGTFQADNHSDKPKYYVLDMFPYPSGAGLHVGHPLGYIASDIYARFKRHKGFNVLHPQGYDSFGLPAEQYAIQTGQHPAITTETNIARYREQLDKIGFSFDWDREVRTSNPEYYKWTQWIFIQLFNSWYNKDSDRAESICTLIAEFEKNGNTAVNAVSDDNIPAFTAKQWNGWSVEAQEKMLLRYRLTYLAETEVNWCPALGTVLANDEIVNGVSERGGHPVIRKKMTQWSMRISAYAERLLQGLDTIDWTESLKESQRNWIGKSVGALVKFRVIEPSTENWAIYPPNVEFVDGVPVTDLTSTESLSSDLTPDPSPKDFHPPAPSEGGGGNSGKNSLNKDRGYLTGDSTVIGHTLQHAQNMRKEPTVAEATLWEMLRKKNLGERFRRQHPIGVFIADFVCLEKRLIIEVDGSYHNDPEQKELDETRTLELEQKHLFKILRFSNNEIMHDMQVVISRIKTELDDRKSYKDIEGLTGSTPPPSEEAGGKKNSIADGLGINAFFDDISEGLSSDEETRDVIEVFTTRPDTIFGVTFMTLAPEHDLVAKITTPDQKHAVADYIEATAKRSERDRMADVKTISGVFTGAYAEHPFTKEPIPVWIGDYVLAGYGTGAVMAVPAGDQRDYDFAKHFNIDIKNIFEDVDISTEAYGAKDNIKLIDSAFLDGYSYKEASKRAIEALEDMGQGQGRTNYRLRDAVFSRQRYWGEPFPVYYVNGLPQLIDKKHLPVRLPDVEKYLPTEDGQPPLGNSKEWAWSTIENKVVANELIDNVSVFPLELNTMPGWAGSSWYWLRYMDAHNEEDFVSKEAEAYWQNVDLYIGGSEHATGHLLYSRFWNKFLKDRGFINSEEPFKKLINQGMILGMSAYVFKVLHQEENTPPILISYAKYFKEEKIKNIDSTIVDYEIKLQKIFDEFASDVNIVQGYNGIVPIHVDVNLVNSSDELNIQEFRNHPLYKEYKDAIFISEEDGTFKVSREVEKMSKSKYNVVTPDDICADYGADTLRLYEMFLGPLEQAKPWNTAGITGVFGFLKKLWKLYFDESGLIVTSNPASKEAYKILHRTIKKTQD
ncbi:MAG: DUF559 domain-containing protein, partial [Flavobacterium sp.]